MLSDFKKKRDKSEINAKYQEQWNKLKLMMMTMASYGNIEDALTEGGNLLSYSKEKFGRYSRQAALSMNIMGEICISDGKYEQAETYLNEALKICEKALGRYVKESSIAIKNLSKLSELRSTHITVNSTDIKPTLNTYYR